MNSISIFEHLYELSFKNKEEKEKRNFISFCVKRYRKFKEGCIDAKNVFRECQEKYPEVNALLLTATFYQIKEYDKIINLENITVPETSKYIINNYLKNLKKNKELCKISSSEDLIQVEEELAHFVPECYKEATLEEFRREVFSTSI